MCSLNDTDLVDFVLVDYGSLMLDVANEIKFEGEEENEIGINIKTGSPVIRIDKKYFRPAEVDTLLGNPKKANDELNWKATTSLEKLAEIMVEYDLQSVGN